MRMLFVKARSMRTLLTKTSVKTLSRLGTVVALCTFAVGCGARSVTINQLKADPGRYQNRSVSIRGTVTSGFGASVVPVGLYTIEDGTGEINVLSRSRGTPSKGARVRVKGRVNQVASVGTRAIGLHLQEENRKGQ
jgi:hypothetical protein